MGGEGVEGVRYVRLNLENCPHEIMQESVFFSNATGILLGREIMLK